MVAIAMEEQKRYWHQWVSKPDTIIKGIQISIFPYQIKAKHINSSSRLMNGLLEFVNTILIKRENFVKVVRCSFSFAL
jgi:hypothetical protein